MKKLLLSLSLACSLAFPSNIFTQGQRLLIKPGNQIYSTAAASITAPTDLANTKLWLDGNDNSSTGMTLVSTDHVSVWKDKSGNAYNFSEGTDANRPIDTANVKNGKRALAFNGSKKLVNATDQLISTGSAFTMAMVLQNTYGPVNYNYPMIVNCGDAVGWSMAYRVASSNGPRWGSKNAGSYASIQSSAALSNQEDWHYFTITYNGSGADTASNYDIYFDGVLQTTAGSFSDSGTGTASVIGQYQNSVADPDYGLRGYWGEWIIYSDKKNSTDLAKLHAYIVSKWGF